MSVKAELAAALRHLARLENDARIRARLLADADSIPQGRGRLSSHHADLARKLRLLP